VLEAGATLGGGVEITGGSLVATGNAGGTIDLKGGLVGGVAPAIFSFGPGCTWTSGTIAGLSKVVTGGTLATSGTSFKGVGGFSTLTIDGLLQWAGGAPIDGNDTSNIVVTTGGKFEVTADGDLFSRFYSNNRLTVAGTLEKSAGTGALWIDEWFVELSGTIRCKSGSVDISADSSVLPGAGFDGSGRTRWVAGNIGVRGTSTIQSGATVEFAGASINGNVDGTACFQGGAIDWSAGWLNGWIVLNSTTTLTGPAGKVIGGFSELRNAGTMVTGGSGTLTGWDSSKLRNLPGATLTCAGGNHFANFYGNNRLVNEGTMTLGSAGAPGRQTMDWAFEQTSTGRLLLDVAGPEAVTPVPQFDNLSVGSGVLLAGRLDVAKVNGYAPAADTIFPFVGGSGISGTFAIVQAPGFSVEYEGAVAKLRTGSAGLAFQTWATDHGLTGDDAAADADPDHDHVVNFLEYAFNLDPMVPGPAPTSSEVLIVEGQRWLSVRYRRWQDRIEAGVAYSAEASANLGTWNTPGVIDEADPDAAPVAGSDARRCRILIGAGKVFLRLRVE